MSFAWAGRQFVGGALCLDLVNTVYYADDATRRGDRLRGPEDIAGWLAAACRFGAAGAYAGMLAVPAGRLDAAAVADLLSLRQAADDLFRGIAHGSEASPLALRRVLFELGSALSAAGSGIGLAAGAHGLMPLAAAPSPAAVRAALAHSALALAHSPLLARLKICPGCNWLFVDRSRNASRLWCDMLTCGNRAKAQRHYAARRAREESNFLSD